MDSQKLLEIAAKACDDKRAENIVALDMQEVSLIADYFLICHGSNERQVDAISKGIKEAVEEEGFNVKKIEGRDQSRWVLVDLEFVVVHIFHKDEREYYNLEKLWGDAGRVPLDL
ncbi:ribosome silencing factor [Filobacillus milosensis]|uniref:Ribosomal silencing factor RsfS n=1 Tax=Filobacillus milosensis TaxID=94137 RepID=A0A4Y8ISJ3_9BACI|nr:ribosome silencing factor [Filobacillus milosensis]TFB24870.1 ribosome silencing factor [Filobacillus milosensis]